MRPKGNWWITPSRRTSSGPTARVLRVDDIHLHHAVWLAHYGPTWAAGEEKTRAACRGLRLRDTTDQWLMSHMIQAIRN